MSPGQKTVAAWLGQWVAVEGSDPWVLDERGMLGLQTDQGLHIELEVPADGGVLFLRAALGPLPQQDGEAVYAKLLALNFLQQQAGGASFAIDEEQHQLALSICQGIAHLDGTDFENLLRGFVSAAVDWHDKVNHRPYTDW